MSFLESNARTIVENGSDPFVKVLEKKTTSLPRKLVDRVNHHAKCGDLAEPIRIYRNSMAGLSSLCVAFSKGAFHE